MGCFFACFRIRDHDQRRAHRFPARSTDPVVSRSQLASVLLWGGNGSPEERAAGRSSGESGGTDGVDSAIKREAKFLKSIGTLQETPEEIRKVSGKTFVQTTNGCGLSANSLLPDTYHRKLEWNEDNGQISDPLSQVHESSGRQHELESCHSEEHQKSRKATRFKGQTDDSGVDLVSDSVKDVSPPQNHHIDPIVTDSPYPTPVHLTDEMQTPGTVYPASLESPCTWRNARTRTQYVYPVFDMENSEVPRETSIKVSEQVSCTPDHREGIVQISPPPVPKNPRLPDSLKDAYPTDETNQNEEIHFKEESAEDMNSSDTMSTLTKRDQNLLNPRTSDLVVPSLSEWLKPPRPKKTVHECSPSSKSPDVDRPIIGLVATHWIVDEPSHVSPNGWDGNGIPNSTNKYKEDQKVSWHATPFEERLEKALSDETLFPQRKHCNGKPIHFEDEGEEADTAAS